LKNQFLQLLSLFFLLFCASCSKESKNIFSRAYHTTTARYNAYFNGKESLISAIANLEKTHKDDYDKVIPLYIYTNASTVSSVSSSADVAIKKSSKMINKHSMMIKSRQYNRWIDENYMLLGKAQFYKMDYKSATQTFEYVAKMSKNEKEIDPKEEKKRFKRYMLYAKKALKSDSHKWEAYLWLTRTYIENKQFDKAQTVLDLMEFDEHFPKKLQGVKASVYADYYIKQDNYSPALVNLEEAISNTKKKPVKARFLFGTAQIYTELGNSLKAIEKYTQLLKINRISYEMEFTARINRALLYGSQEDGKKMIRKELQKMIRDKKNLEYNDQIYYVLATLDQKENLIASAIENYQSSIESSVSNQKQKAKSCINLADIYYGRAEYELAYAFYDSSLALITTSFPDYDKISERKNNLTDLVKNLKIVSAEDSLQRLAAMNDSERAKFVDAIVEAEMQKAAEKLKQSNTASANNADANINNTPGAWYFYNSNMISQGKTQFIKLWGDRKLEDNWRRSNKNSSDFFNEESEEDASEVDTTALIVDGKIDPKAAEKLKEKMLKNIPITEEQMKQSNLKIIEAYYNIGTIYKEQFSEYKRAIEAFETLIRKFPDNQSILPSYYQLYRTYLITGDQVSATNYKNMILTQYPESEYAKVILDPDYYKQKMAEQNRLNQLYESAFTAYKSGNYNLAYQYAENALAEIKDSLLLPKLSFIKAQSMGHTDSLEKYKTSLNEVIIQYPNTDVAKEAKSILNYINNPDLLLAIKNYDSDIQGMHYYILVVPNTYVNIKKLTDTIASFNAVQLTSDSLQVSSSFLNPQTQILRVQNFTNKDAALNYFDTIREQDDLFSIIQPNKFDQFIITIPNYQLLIAKKEINTYHDFFNKNYVSQ
jgi:tetratricopeptide (TPR) repeat protein